MTVLPVLNNVFERLLSAQMGDFYQNILSDYISAYRRHHSCETSLLRLTEDWRRSLDNKEIMAVISMDLSKAFDTIPHALLLTKLKAYGLHESSCALTSGYLMDRGQGVKIGILIRMDECEAGECLKAASWGPCFSTCSSTTSSFTLSL